MNGGGSAVGGVGDQGSPDVKFLSALVYNVAVHHNQVMRRVGTPRHSLPSGRAHLA